MFKRPTVHYGRTPEPVTPYQSAAQAWDERIGSARVQAKNWRLMAFGCLLLSGGLAAALVWQSTQGTVTPWVVEVDHLGQAQAVAPASPFYQPTDPQIAFHLARFIEDVRGLPADAVVLRQDWLRAYEFTTDRGAAALNDYARTNDPFAKLGICRLRSKSPASSVPRRKAFGSHGLNAATTTASSPRPSAGPRSFPSSSKPHVMPTACARTHWAFTSTLSIGRGSSVREKGYIDIGQQWSAIRPCIVFLARSLRLHDLQNTADRLR